MRGWLLVVLLVARSSAADPEPSPPPLKLTLAMSSVQPLVFTVTVENVGKAPLHVFDRADIGPWLFVLEHAGHTDGCSVMTHFGPSKPFDLAPGATHVVKLGCTLGRAPLLPGGDYEAHVELLGEPAFFPRGSTTTWWEGRARSAPVKVHAAALPALVQLEAGKTYPARANAGTFHLEARDSLAQLWLTHPGNQAIGVGKSVWLAARFAVTADGAPVQVAQGAAWLIDTKGGLHALTGGMMLATHSSWDGTLPMKQSAEVVFGAPPPADVDLAENDQVRFVIEVVDRTGHHAIVETAPATVTHDPKRDTYYP